MRALLVATDDENQILLNSVLEVLNSVKGPIVFDKAPVKITPTLRNENHPEAEWGELFAYCRNSRNQFNIHTSDFVILITSIPNEGSWLSYYRDRNIFVYSGGWENILQVDKKYPIAHQVIENIIQILMEVGDVTENNPYIHYSSTGCLNDFCDNEKEIFFKLKIADVCTTCANRIHERIPIGIKNQCFEILDEIRKGVRIISTSKFSNTPVKIHLIDNSFVLPELNNLKFVMKPMAKAIYHFYLRHLEGVSFTNFCSQDNHKELSLLYSMYCRPKDLENVKGKIDNLIDADSSTFTTAKSNINTFIIDNLKNDELSKHYIISGAPREIFKINLPKELIDSSIR